MKSKRIFLWWLIVLIICLSVYSVKAIPLIEEENFNDGQAQLWHLEGSGFAIKDGNLHQLDKSKGKINSFSFIEKNLKNIVLQLRIFFPQKDSGDVIIKLRKSSKGFYAVRLSPATQKMILYKMVDGTKTDLASVNLSEKKHKILPGRWCQIDFELPGNHINVGYNGILFIYNKVDSDLTSGGVSIETHGGQAIFDDIKIWEFDYPSEDTGTNTVATDDDAFAEKVWIRYIWPEKLFYHPGDKAVGRIVLKNTTTHEQNLTLRIALAHELGSETALLKQRLTLPPRSQKRVYFHWSVGPDVGGYALIGRIEKEGKLLHERREYFTVGLKPTKTGQTSGAPVNSGGQLWRYTKEFPQRMRRSYVNSAMRFSWAPDDFSDLTPDKPTWIASQGHYQESAKNLQALVATCHKYGIEIYTYAKHWLYGPVGFEFMRKHPDWAAYDKKGHFDGPFRADDIPQKDKRKWKRNDSYVRLHCHSNKILDYEVREIAASCKQFGWDGVFFDSEPSLYGTHDFKGLANSDLPFWGYNIYASNIDYLNTQLLKTEGKRFGIGYNFYNGIRTPHLMAQYREAISKAWILYEESNKLDWPGQPKGTWNKWQYFSNAVGHTARCTRMGGGDLYAGYIWQGCAVYNRMHAAIILANGGHVAACIQHGAIGYENMFRLATRFAHLLYGFDVRSLPRHFLHAEVRASREIWWKDFMYERPLKGGGKEFIIHLVNSPSSPSASRLLEPEPPKARNVSVSIMLPKGKTLRDAWVLTLDEPLERKVHPRIQAEHVTIDVPAFTYWTICVFRTN